MREVGTIFYGVDEAGGNDAGSHSLPTLGVDLAAADENTAACRIDWTASPAPVETFERVNDDQLVELILGADKAGLDVPFGWPDEFVEFVSAHHTNQPLPDVDRPHLRLRETDRTVHAACGRWPLSVSADRIAIPAMRAAVLLARLAERGEPVDRSGAGRVVEVYPAAALAIWKLPSSGYKGAKGAGRRRDLIAELHERTGSWLAWSDDVRAACEASDDVLDSLVAALIARAAALGLCEPTPVAYRDRAKREGWIALPTGSNLSRLVG